MARSKRNTGGVNQAEDDLKDKPVARGNPKTNIYSEAEERKCGGRMKRKRGGKMVGMEGEKAKMHAGRKPRKSGGATSDSNPFTSARSGTDPRGHHTDDEMDKF